MEVGKSWILKIEVIQNYFSKTSCISLLAEIIVNPGPRLKSTSQEQNVCFVTSTSQGQKFQKFEEYPKSVRIKMADLAGR